MALSTLANRFLEDLKANRTKSALLGVLFLVGLYFWIPLLYRAVFGDSPGAARPQQATAGAQMAAQLSATTPAATPHPDTDRAEPGRPPAPPAPDAPGQTPAWQTIDRTLRTDPLFQPADVDSLATDPFRLDTDQFSPPVLFAEESSQNAGGAARPEGLVLKTIVIGPTQRSAFINQKLYQEGTAIVLDGRTYRLMAVRPRKVVLENDGKLFELTIDERRSSGHIEVHRTETDR